MQKRSDELLLSVVIPVHRGGKEFEKNLRKLIDIGGLTREQFEIIAVSSGGKTDISRNITEDVMIHVIEHDMDIGRAAARNAGIEKASGRRILFLDEDMYPESELLKIHGERDDSKALLGKVSFADSCRTCMDLALDTASYFDELNSGNEYNFIKFITANISVPTEILKASGGFSEDFEGWGYEDLEFGYRLEKNHGLKIVYDESASAIHCHEKTLDEYMAKSIEKGQNSVRFFMKHPAAASEIKFEVDSVIDNYNNPEFFPGDMMIDDMKSSCIELEEMGTWKENRDFRKMLVDFYRNLFRHLERRGIRNYLTRLIKPVAVVIIAKQGVSQVLNTLGSIISNKYPLEDITVIIFDPKKIKGVGEFFRTYSPPVKLKYFNGNEEDLKNTFRLGNIHHEYIMFIDDSLRASRGWILSSCIEHGSGVEKVDGMILPNTTLGRYLSLRKLFISNAAIVSKNINVSFTKTALIEKKEADIVKGKSQNMLALRSMPVMVSRWLTDIIKFYRYCTSDSGLKSKKISFGFFLSFLKIGVHAVRLWKSGNSVQDSILFPVFDKIRYYTRQS